MSDTDFKSQKCQPCEGLGQALTRAEAEENMSVLPKWQLADDAQSITRTYCVKNFIAAIELFNDVAHIAEEENHHPDLNLSGYRNVSITLSTHALGGLSINDFIVATKIDTLSVLLKG